MDYFYSKPFTDVQKRDVTNFIKSKLTEITGDCDEVFLEYVMVMISNGKTMAQISSELVAFVGDSASQEFSQSLGKILLQMESDIVADDENVVQAITSADRSVNQGNGVKSRIINLNVGNNAGTYDPATRKSGTSRLLQAAIRSSVSISTSSEDKRKGTKQSAAVTTDEIAPSTVHQQQPTPKPLLMVARQSSAKAKRASTEESVSVEPAKRQAIAATVVAYDPHDVEEEVLDVPPPPVPTIHRQDLKGGKKKRQENGVAESGAVGRAVEQQNLYPYISQPNVMLRPEDMMLAFQQNLMAMMTTMAAASTALASTNAPSTAATTVPLPAPPLHVPYKHEFQRGGGGRGRTGRSWSSSGRAAARGRGLQAAVVSVPSNASSPAVEVAANIPSQLPLEGGRFSFSGRGNGRFSGRGRGYSRAAPTRGRGRGPPVAANLTWVKPPDMSSSLSASR